MMGHSFFCVLEFFFFILVLNTPFYYGHAEDAVLTLEPSWSTFFTGESVTFICDINEGKDTDWFYKINKGGREFLSYGSNKDWTISSLSTGYSDVYQCFGTHKSSLITKSSNNISLNVSAYKPKATLTPRTTTIPRGGRVTLSCSVDIFGGWKYDWFGQTSYNNEAPITTVGEENRVITVSEGGVYRCRGRRGQPVFYTDVSSYVTIVKTISNYVTVTPNWPQMFSGETITLRCEIQGGGDTGWQYCWRTPWSTTEWTNTNSWTFSVSVHSSGNYMCKGRYTWDPYALTEWSKPVTVAVADKPRPVLTVSPSWLSPGASVTLNCEVEHPSAGFYWYKTVPDLSDKYYRYYRYELLPGRDNGTEQNSSIIHGQTHTAGYVCRAGRGDPVYYTDHSGPKFVWSGDVHPSASLTVNPDKVQHFTSDSVSVSCEGNTTEWRVRMFTDGGFLSQCYYSGTMTGPTCNISTSQSGTAVYWCESGSGEFSNAVNITVQHQSDIMLVSPVLPVTEGTSVTLGCKFKKENVLSQVFFYKNDKLIQNDTRVELSIFAVSKSDEGVYKCKIKKNSQLWTSPQSWMSVKLVSTAESSSFPVPLIVGLVCGVLPIILLLPLCCYRKIKDSRFLRSQSTNQSSATDHMIDQDESQDRKHALHGDVCLYESIKDPEGTEYDDSRDLTYSSIELKNITNDDDTLMYTDVHFLNKGKAKKNKGKSSPAVADATIYSEVQAQITLGNNAEIK
ncbi:Fc receptor-like protein 5 [Channa argus]|uniref:Fc receptor-like protein 5 n=1 Tax=Channa argus TaxID=215402 RepID=A0A6G1Q5Z8_CHAAH|nr:Fc receptor-like protein 5 [Channa argus]